MNKLLILFLLVTNLTFSQTIIQYDRMETWNWAGLWFIPATTATWATNASTSAAESAVIYGLGSGTSAIEQDWYSLPNVTGLDATRQYQLKFRLASYNFTSTATSKGVDAADYVSVQVSTNGGFTYVNELRIIGNANAIWPYTSTGTITHTANGTFTNSAAPAGDVYQAPAGVTTTGPSTITLNLPLGITQVAVDLYCRVNSAGEEFWIDDIELWDLTPVGLPIELTYFEGRCVDGSNLIQWQTASEYNSSHFILERSTSGEFSENTIISLRPAAGNSTQLMDYSYVDNDFDNCINYYKLTQVDFDGKYKEYGPIVVNNSIKVKKIVRTINLMGQDIDPNSAHGICIEVYEDGTIKKVLR